MKNKHAKIMLTDLALKDRKLCWFCEDTEIFLAKNEQHLIDTYGYPDPEDTEDQYGELNPYKYLWKNGFCEEEGVQRIICWTYGNADECSQISSSYA